MRKLALWVSFVAALSLSVSAVLSYTQQVGGGFQELRSKGIQPTPWYVPPEKFVPLPSVELDGSVAPNTLVNSLEVCGGRGIVQSETSITASGDIVLIAFNDSRGFFCPNRSTLGWGYSLDGGKTFADGGTLPGGRTPWSNGDPWVVTAPDGSFYISGISTNFNGMSVSHGYFDGKGISWSDPVQAIRPGGSIDKEAMAVDQNTGTVFMAYSRSQIIEVVRSEDEGQTWSAGVRPGSNGIGALPLVGPDSTLYVFWLFGWPNPTQFIRFSRSDDGGQSFTAPLNITNVCVVNVPGFSRGQMPAFPMAAIDQSGGDFNGRLYLTWHSSCSGQGEVYLSWSDDYGETWSKPVIVNDDGTFAIQFSPTVSVDEYGTVSVAFYDRRENPGTAITNVYFAQSFDGGATFSENVRLTDTPTNWAATASDITPNLGDYMYSVTAGSDVLVTWSDGRAGHPDAYFTRITPPKK